MNKNIFKLFFILTLGTYFMSSCLKDDLNEYNDYPPQAGFSMINAYSGSDFVIHKADNNFIQTMNEPLRFKEINFVYLYPGNRKIQTINKENKILMDSTFSIKNGSLYTSFLFTKSGNKLGQHLVSDTLVDNLASNSAIRFLNFAFDKNNIDVYLDDTQIIENRNFDGNAVVFDHFKFISQPSGVNKITVKDANQSILAEKELTFSAGIHYTLLLIKSSGENKYELIAHQQYRN